MYTMSYTTKSSDVPYFCYIPCLNVNSVGFQFSILFYLFLSFRVSVKESDKGLNAFSF